MQPDIVQNVADVMRRCGIRLKEMPKSDLPYSEEEKVAARRSPGVRWGYRKAA